MTLPSALQDLATANAWVTWRWVTLPNGKRDKPPFRADYPDFHASTQNPRTWGPFSAACAAWADRKVDGIGYVLRDDPRHVFIDMDKCRNPETGEIDDWAMRIIEAANSYTEITPSGAGVRIIGYGEHLGRQIHTAYKFPGGGSGEIFFRAPRFVTVTGNRLPGTPDNLADISDITTEMLMMSGKASGANSGAEPFSPSPAAAADIADVIAALAVIPNPGADVPYDDWVRIGLAVFAATGGSDAGRQAWEQWSAKSSKYIGQECERVWQSIRRAPPKRIGFGTLYYQATSNDPFFVPPSWRAKATPFEEPAASGGTEQPAAGPDVFPTYGIGEIIAMPPPVWLVEGVITTDGVGGFYGPPGSLKSFLALGMSLCLAYGKPWMGREVQQVGVLYVAAEGVRGMGRRIRAWQHKHGLAGVDAPFRLLAATVNLTEPAQAAKLIRTAMAAAEAEGCRIGLVVIDTVARAMAGADENSAQDMGLFIAGLDAIKQHVGCAVLGIHHSGKDATRGARGSSAFLGAMDMLARVERSELGDLVTLTIEKQKEDEEGDPLTLAVEKIDLGGDMAKPESSLVLTLAAAQPKAATPDTSRMELIDRIARIVGEGGRAKLPVVCDGLGKTRKGENYAEITGAIPFAPGGVDVTIDGQRLRLWCAKEGKHSTAPIVVVCHAVP